MGNALRRAYWKRRLDIGSSPRILRGAAFYGSSGIVIGRNFSLAEHSIIDASSSEGIYIGDHVAVARDVFVRAANHRFDDLNRPILEQGHESAKISYRQRCFSVIIEDGTLLSRGVTVLSGAHIGEGSVIGVSAVVSGVVPPFSIVIGNPGRVIRSRKHV